MAKRLEEHLYRSALTKEEYLNTSTLKKRLQMIAHSLGVQKNPGEKETGEVSKSGLSANTENNQTNSSDQASIIDPQSRNKGFHATGSNLLNMDNSSGPMSMQTPTHMDMQHPKQHLETNMDLSGSQQLVQGMGSGEGD